MSNAVREIPRTVRLEQGHLLVDGFTEDDPTVVGIVGRSSDLEEGLRSCLSVGARALDMSTTAIDELAVGKAFEQMTQRLGAMIELAVDRVRGLTDVHDGPIAGLLADVHSTVTDDLSRLFDPNSKASALGLMDDTFAKAITTHERTLRANLNPDDAETPLGRWRLQIHREIADAIAQIRGEVRELSEGLAIRQARAEAEARGTAKGLLFEDLVAREVSELCCHQGDQAEALGRESGIAGSKIGDIVVTLNPQAVGGRSAKFVIEAKNRKLGLRRVLNELDLAMTNREAQAAVAVFAASDQAPVPVSFVPFDNKAIVVMDDGSPDPQAIRLACLWARWVVVRSLSLASETVDVALIEALIDDAQRALRRSSTIRRSHASARKAIDQASSELTSLIDEADFALNRLNQELHSP